MIDKDIQADMFDSNVRMAKIIHLQGMMSCDRPSRRVMNVLQDENEIELSSLLPDFKLSAADVMDEDALIQYLIVKNYPGFIVRFDTPIPCNIRKKGGYSSSWSKYCWQWIYAETLQEACEKSLEWHESVVKAAYSEAGVEYAEH